MEVTIRVIMRPLALLAPLLSWLEDLCWVQEPAPPSPALSNEPNMSYQLLTDAAVCCGTKQNSEITPLVQILLCFSSAESIMT